MVDPHRLIGYRLGAVTASWLHHPEGPRSLLHVWLHFDGLEPVQLHTPGHDVTLELSAPHGPYDMGDHGHVVVEAAPPDFVASRFVGERLQSVELVPEPTIETAIGFVLHFPDGGLRVRNIRDELVFDLAHPPTVATEPQ